MDATNGWESWFAANNSTLNSGAFSTEHYLMLEDEPPPVDYPQVQNWTQWISGNSGPGAALKTFAATSLIDASSSMTGISAVGSTMSTADTVPWDTAEAAWKKKGKTFMMYNGEHPASGSFATEAEGTDLRELPWGQFKKGIDRWFNWESTYYNNYQFGVGQTNLFNSAVTFGSATGDDVALGQSGPDYMNGGGVLFYPGTDLVNKADSFGVEGPIASVRLKLWRRGIQDVDYLTMATAKDPVKVQAILAALVPKVLWENGIDSAADQSYVKCGLGWSQDPDKWEEARAQLADIIEGK